MQHHHTHQCSQFPAACAASSLRGQLLTHGDPPWQSQGSHGVTGCILTLRGRKGTSGIKLEQCLESPTSREGPDLWVWRGAGLRARPSGRHSLCYQSIQTLWSIPKPSETVLTSAQTDPTWEVFSHQKVQVISELTGPHAGYRQGDSNTATVCTNIRTPVFQVHTYTPAALTSWGLFPRSFPQKPPALSGNRGRSCFAFVLPQICSSKHNLLLFTHNTAG